MVVFAWRGGLEAGETPAEGALRELNEECNVTGAIVRQTAHVGFGRYFCVK